MHMRGQPVGLALLLLLGSASSVLGDLIATDTYSCDPAKCKPPTCLCAANNPPGGLKPDQIPQFVLLAHDNALDGLPYDLMLRLIGNKTQANDCIVPVTWFAQRYHSNCDAGQAALARGDEVAMQANRFPPTDPFNATDPNPHYDSRDPVTGKPSVAREIQMSREWWNQTCGLPLYDMIGFRAQEYYNNPPIRETLSSSGWLYDATLPETYYPNSPTSPSLNQTLWPYTMDSGIPQQCDFYGPDIGRCSPGENYAGLWEVPLYNLQDGDTVYGVSAYGDTEITGVPAVSNMGDLFKSQLDMHLANGRPPLAINVYYEWLSDKPANPPADDPRCLYCVRDINANGRGLVDFVDYAVTKPEVRFVTYSDLVRWMQDPVPLDEFDEWVQCTVPGVKADLTAVNLTAADKAGAFYLTGQGAAVPIGVGSPEGSAAPEDVSIEAPTPSMARRLLKSA